MGNNRNAIKDFFYNSIDYIMILGIVIVVGGIITWRLDTLFDENIIAESLETMEVEKLEKAKENKEVAKAEDPSKKLQDPDLKKTKKEGSKIEDKKATRDKPLEEKSGTIKVNIPEGSDSSTIADILKSHNIIKDPKEFLDKCEQMEKATKLRAGDFEIEKNISVEAVINSITK